VQRVVPGLTIQGGTTDAEVRAIAMRSEHGVEAIDNASE